MRKMNHAMISRSAFCGVLISCLTLFLISGYSDNRQKQPVNQVKSIKSKNKVKQVNQLQVYHADQPLEINGRRGAGLLRFQIDPEAEHVYGISYEARGAPGMSIQPARYRCYSTNGSSLFGNFFDNGYGAFRMDLDDTRQTGRVEVFTKRGSAQVELVLETKGQGQAQVFNVQLHDGGFPDNPPVAGAPYPAWIDSLKADHEIAGTNPIWGSAGGNITQLQADVRAYVDMPVENLVQLMPERRPFAFNDNRPLRKFRWSPAEPDILRDQNGEIFDFEKKYPVSGYDEAETPSGKVVKYPYSDPPGVTAQPPIVIKGELELPARWRVFGTLKQEDPVLPAAVLKTMPEKIKVRGVALKGVNVETKAGCLDFTNLFGPHQVGMTAYVFSEIIAEHGTDLTLGAGCDWWMQWWVNGQPVCDTLKQGNGNWPPSIKDHIFQIHLRKGKNILAGRIISGSGSFVMAVGGPAELRQMNLNLCGKPPKGRIYMDEFMTTARVNELNYAAYELAVLYNKTGKHDYALRAAVILAALGKVMPDWPIFGRGADIYDPTSLSVIKKFYSPDHYEDWMAFILSWEASRPEGSNESEWYPFAMGGICGPARSYDLIRGAPVWEEASNITGRNARQDIENGFLHVCKMALKYDAYRRSRLWEFYHNIIVPEIKAFITVGRAIGCPELVHYAIKKSEGLYHYTFMADGMFPESPSYFNQIVGDLKWTFNSYTKGYTDRDGFKAVLDNKRFDSFNPVNELPLYGLSLNVLDRLHFPNGDILTIHDTWPNSISPVRNPPRRSVVEPFLLPDFGHGIVGSGKDSDRIESHLHYSGAYGHRHFDMLNFILWAYGDELTADLGYSHLSLYKVGAPAHNLVVINGENQEMTGVGNLLAWHAGTGVVQVIQAESPQAAYKAADKYRRTLIVVPEGPGRDAIVDIFEARGGQRHEWMANGCADYAQKLETDLAPEKELDNLSEDGQAMTEPPRMLRDNPGKKNQFYGAFRHARICKNDKTWQVTMTAEPPVPKNTPGAGPRAIADDPKPGLRLHWLAPLDGQAILCQAPRNRYLNETGKMEEASKAWGKEMMPKIIVRRDGTNLDSTFVAVWEPFQKQPELKRVRCLPEISTNDGVGVAWEREQGKTRVLYRRPESKTVLKSGEISADGSFTVLSQNGTKNQLAFYDGTQVKAGPIQAFIPSVSNIPVQAMEEKNGQYHLIGKSVLAGYPAEPARQPHAGQFVKFAQTGQFHRWLPMKGIEQSDGDSVRLILSRDPGFNFVPEREYLRETYFPFRTMRGAAAVVLPVWLNIEWQTPSNEGEKISSVKVRAGGDVRLKIDGLKDVVKARVKGEQMNDYTELPVSRSGDAVVMELSPAALGKGWWDVKLE